MTWYFNAKADTLTTSGRDFLKNIRCIITIIYIQPEMIN